MLIFRDSSFCDDDVCTTFATVGSETSSPVISGGPTDDSEQESNKNQQSTASKGELPVPVPVPKDVVMTVKEAGEGSTAKKGEGKAQDLPSTSKQEDTEPKPSGMGKLSFGGVANTLLQWKLNRMRAAKRRSQSIAIVSIYVVYDAINHSAEFS